MIMTIYIVQVTAIDPAAATPSRDAAFREIAEGVAALSSRRRCAIARRVHHSGISLGHLQILWILQEHGPLPVSRLADWLGIGAPNATGLLDRMEQRGLVERARTPRLSGCARPHDRRGRAAIAEHDGWGLELVEQVLAPRTTSSSRLRRAFDAHVTSNHVMGSPPPGSARRTPPGPTSGALWCRTPASAPGAPASRSSARSSWPSSSALSTRRS
jgi:hypothetical protein